MLDLVISFDDTGSMHAVRKQVRQRVNELVDNLHNNVDGLRIGVIIHNDYCDMPNHIYSLDLTSDMSSVKNFVNRSSPQGGGDAPECYELALHTALNFNWIADRRALIMIGDEVPHEKGYRYGSHVVNLEWKKVVEELRSNNVKVYGVQALGRRSSNYFYDHISRYTNGVKLDLSQFQHINTYISAITYHQQGNLETFQQSDPSFRNNLALRNMFSKLMGNHGSAASAEFESRVELLSRFQVMDVFEDCQIRNFVEDMGATFVKGKGFYQLIERTPDGKANFEEIQANKQVIFVDKSTGEAIDDTNWCRHQLGVPYGTKGKVRPLQIPEVMSKYDVFVQSTSYTRKLDRGTKFLYEVEYR